MTHPEAPTFYSSRSMSNRSSNRTKRALRHATRKLTSAAMCAALLTAPAFASKKDDDYKKAQAAEGRGDAIEAAKMYCALRDEDEKFKDVVAKCNMWSQETRRLRQQDVKRLEEGRQALKEGRLDDAEDLLKKIKIADLAAQAKDDLSAIAAKRSEANAASAADAKFQQGVQAYGANDLARAKDSFRS